MKYAFWILLLIVAVFGFFQIKSCVRNIGLTKVDSNQIIKQARDSVSSIQSIVLHKDSLLRVAYRDTMRLRQKIDSLNKVGKNYDLKFAQLESQLKKSGQELSDFAAQTPGDTALINMIANYRKKLSEADMVINLGKMSDNQKDSLLATLVNFQHSVITEKNKTIDLQAKNYQSVQSLLNQSLAANVPKSKFYLGVDGQISYNFSSLGVQFSLITKKDLQYTGAIEYTTFNHLLYRAGVMWHFQPFKK